MKNPKIVVNGISKNVNPADVEKTALDIISKSNIKDFDHNSPEMKNVVLNIVAELDNKYGFVPSTIGINDATYGVAKVSQKDSDNEVGQIPKFPDNSPTPNANKIVDIARAYNEQYLDISAPVPGNLQTHIPELVDNNGRTKNIISNVVSSIAPTYMATYDMIAAVACPESFRKGEYTALRKVINENFRTVSNHILQTMTSSIEMYLNTLIKHHVGSEVFDNNNTGFYYQNRYHFPYHNSLGCLSDLGNYIPLYYSGNDIKEYSVSRNLFPAEVTLYNNIVNMSFIAFVRNIIANNNLEPEIYNDIMTEFGDNQDAVTCFIVDTLKELMKQASLHIGMLYRDGVDKVPNNDRKFWSCPFAIRGFDDDY